MKLSVYHRRRVVNARKRTGELRDLKVTLMGEDDVRLWLVRMEVIAQDLLNIIALMELDGALQEVRDDC